MKIYRGIKRASALLLASLLLLGGCRTNPGPNGSGEAASSGGTGDTVMTEEEYQAMIDKLCKVPEAADVDGYEIASDRGMIYNPLSREAAKTGELEKYVDAAGTKGTIRLGNITLEYTVPKTVTAYDAVPIRYTLTVPKGTTFPVHVEGTAFEEESRRQGRDYYDMALPGKTDLSFEYLGYVAGHLKEDARNIMKADLSDDPAAAYPNYDTTELTRSGVVEAADINWFRFRYTNTGDTILDPEGTGAFQFKPELQKKNASGNYEFIAYPYNKYYRTTDYLYPGESGEIWFNFGPHTESVSKDWGLSAGEYRIILRAVYRNEQTSPENFMRTIWDGPDMCLSTFDFTVEDQPRQTEPAPIVKGINAAGMQNMWLHTFEEFMTSFDTYRTAGQTETSEGTLYVQVAPFTEQIVLKLITANPLGIKTAAIPVTVDTDSLTIDFNPDNINYVVKEDGTRTPAVITQGMADMRANIQLSPYPQEQIVSDLLDMKEHGINLLATTSMPWVYDYNGGTIVEDGSVKFNYQGDAFRFMLDVAREAGLALEGFGNYPFKRMTASSVSLWAFKKSYTLKNASPGWLDEASGGDPNLPLANAAQARYQFLRWGDNYWMDGNGVVPISAEDTRGWMRIDLDTRFPLGTYSIGNFAKWAKEKYGSLEAINKAWGSDFQSFGEINPEKDGVKNQFGWLYEYKDTGNVFHDWTQAMMDLDVFRTEERAQNYKDFLAELKDILPNAKVALRTEGANWIVSGIDPATSNSHYRHVYYSQRRCGIIAEILQASGTIRSHSDYCTMPYTPTEVRELTQKSVEQGVIPMLLTQFDNMRDIAVNSSYGNPFKMNYNLKSADKGAFVKSLTALFPWFKATYEAGGVPGVLWQDYECDGYVTVTQKKELKFFMSKMEEALATPEGKVWATEFTAPDMSFRDASKAKYSCEPTYIRKLIDKLK